MWSCPGGESACEVGVGWRMRKNEHGWRTAVRFGVPFGVGLAVLGSVNGIVQAHRLAVGPSARGLAIFSYLWLLAIIIGVVLASQMSARASGSLGVGVRAGAITSALSTTIVFFIFIFSTTLQNQLASPSARNDPLIVNVLLVVVILLLFSVVGGGLIGALVAIPGALFGRWQAHAERLNTPSLPEQPSFVQLEPADELSEPLESHGALDYEALMEMIEASSEDIVINPSLVKSLLFFLIALALAMGSYAMASSGQNVVIGWIGAGLFGLALPLAPINIVYNRPLLRFGVHGIAYKGAYSFWRRGEVPWQDVGAIVLAKAPRMLFGRYELSLFIEGQRRWRATFQNWQLPPTTQETLEEVMFRFRHQIEENGVVMRGVE